MPATGVGLRATADNSPLASVNSGFTIKTRERETMTSSLKGGTGSSPREGKRILIYIRRVKNERED